MTRTSCPEALHGQHSDPNTSGNCVYCGQHIARPKQYGPRRGHRSLPDQFLDRELERREPRPEQDPLAIDPDPDDVYYDEL